MSTSIINARGLQEILPTIIHIPSEHAAKAQELCGKLIVAGKTFHCVKTASGWVIEVEP